MTERRGAVMAPPLKEIICPWTPQSWLLNHLNPLLSAGKAYRQFMAVGILTRHLMPDDPSERHAFMRAEADQQPVSITRIAREWVKSLGTEEIALIQREAHEHVDALIRMLATLIENDWQDGELIALAISREWLDASGMLLKTVGAASALAPRLRFFDAAVESRAPKELFAKHRDIPLLDSLRRQGKICWWANVAGISLPPKDG